MTDRFQIVFNIIQQEGEKPYTPGVSDCFFTMLKNVDALSGTNLEKHYTGSYKTIPDAFKAMKKRGFKSITLLLKSHLDEAAPATLGIGDVAVVERDGQQHSAICVGERFVAKTENGNEFFTLSEVVSGFRV